MSSCCTKAPSPMCSWWFGRMRRTRPRVEGPTASVREEYTATATVFKRNSKTYEVFRRGGDIVARVHLVCLAPGTATGKREFRRPVRLRYSGVLDVVVAPI